MHVGCKFLSIFFLDFLWKYICPSAELLHMHLGCKSLFSFLPKLSVHCKFSMC